MRDASSASDLQPLPTAVAADRFRQSADEIEIRRRLDDVTRLVSDLIWETDENLNITYVSERVFELLGIHPCRIVGRRLSEVLNFQDAGAEAANVAARRPFRNVPCDAINRDGQKRHFLISGLPIFALDSGQFEGLRGTAEDVTERQATEAMLRRREAVLQAVSRAANALLAAADWRTEMPAILARLGRASGADFVNIFGAGYGAGGENIARTLFQWRNPQLSTTDDNEPRDIPLQAFGFNQWEKYLRAGETVAGAVKALPQGQRWFLAREGVGSVLAVPIFCGSAWWGFIRFDAVDAGHEWPDAEVQAVKAAAGIIGGAIHRQRQEMVVRESEQRFATAFQTSPDAIVITRFGNGTVLEVNEGFSEITAHPRDEVVGRTIGDLDLWADGSLHRRMLRGLIRDGEVRDMEAQFRMRDGAERIGLMTARVVELSGEQCVLSVTRDITGRIRANEAIRKLSQAVEQSPVLVTITDTQGVIEYVNPKFVEITGYTPEEVIGKTPTILKSGHTSEEEYRAMWRQILGGKEWRGEFYNRKKDGQYFWAAQSISPIRSAEGTITHYISVSEDITARRFYEERLRHQAHYDPLTDLPNRTLFFDRLPRALARARRDGNSLSLMFIDLDNFKYVNESIGHDGGDEVLRQVAARLSARIGAIDTVARLASDEFAVVLAEGGDRYHAAAIVPDILATLAEPFQISNAEVYVHASIGIAVFPDDGHDEYSLLKNADTATHRAKELGGNTYQFFAPGMNAKAMTYITLGRHLRHAEERGELELYYQPVVDVRSGAVVGAESLLRWRHPEFGVIPPDKFISLAEDNGLIEPIGEWVLREACRQNRQWRDEGLGCLRIAVNVSSRQFKRGRLVGAVFAALNDSGLSPSNLAVEITESAFLADVEETNSILRKLSGMGIAVSVDDFGTGYSSLAYLRRLPLNTLKIDRAFVRDITAAGDAAEITDVIIAMAHRLSLNVIAEGVETEEQLEFLRARDCEMMQGHYFSAALTAANFGELLRSGRRLTGPPDLFTAVEMGG